MNTEIRTANVYIHPYKSDQLIMILNVYSFFLTVFSPAWTTGRKCWWYLKVFVVIWWFYSYILTKGFIFALFYLQTHLYWLTLIRWMQQWDSWMHGNLSSQRKLSVFFFPKSWLCKKHVMLTWWLSRNQCSRVQCPHCSNHYIIWLEWEKNNSSNNSYWAQKKKQTSLVSMVNLSHWEATSKAWCPCFEKKRICSTTCKHLHFTVQPLECHFVCWWMQ